MKVSMGKLPESRTEFHAPWTNVALDLFGPFRVKPPGRTTRGKAFADCGKVWGLIVNCLSTRSIHIEVCEGYDTENFLAAFHAFTNIRGLPASVFADNGSQIQAADGTYRSLFSAMDWGKITRDGAPKNIEFKHTNPGSPWENGCSESLIKGIKRSLVCFTGTDSPRIPVLQLQRVFTAIANLLNDRPIGKHPKSPEDARFLCPNDLLLGRALDSVPQSTWPELTGKRGDYAKQVVFTERLVSEWFARWQKLYFDTLVPQRKWHVDCRQVQVGDLVLVRDLNLVRGEWKRGEVIKIFPSADGKVRTVALRYKIFRRSQRPDEYIGDRDRVENRNVRNLVVIIPVENRQASSSS